MHGGKSPGVRTWDIYDYVLGAFAGKLQSILTIGGDGSEAQGAKRKATRFKPMVKFIGPFHLDKGSTATHTLVLPQYVGSVKTMLVAGNNGAYGLAEKVTPVKKPLMILATLPRVLGPMESVKLPVTVFAMEKSVKSVQVSIEANNLLIPQDGTSKTINFTEIGDQIVNFDLVAAKTTGIAKVKVTAKSGSETAQYDIELDVRNANSTATSFVDAIIEPGKAGKEAINQLACREQTREFLKYRPFHPLILIAGSNTCSAIHMDAWNKLPHRLSPSCF